MKESGFYDSYEKFSNLLRTWLVTYGIGALVFLSSQDVLIEALGENDSSELVVLLLFIGIGAQVFGALIYKYSMEILYHGELMDQTKDATKAYLKSDRYVISEWFSESICFELLIDGITVVFYFWATYEMVSAAVT